MGEVRGKHPAQATPVPTARYTTAAPADRVLDLQRSAGNHAVASVLARAPVTTGDQFRTRVPRRADGGTAQETTLATAERRIRNRLDRYNQIANDNAQVPARVTLLGELDHEIYKWFDTLQIQDFDTEPLAGHMRDLMEELDREHVNVVRAAVAANIVPVYTAGLSAIQQQRATRLWTSVSQGAGMLQIEGGGDAAFKDKTLSSMAKMLHTYTGRELIDYLDAPAAGRPPGVGALPVNPRTGAQLTGYETFIVPETQALRHVGIAGATGTNEDSANKPLSQVHGAGPGKADYVKIDRPRRSRRDDYPVVANAEQYNAALLDGKPGFAIRQGRRTEYYEFGTGEGNALVMRYGQFSRGIGAGDVEVISPDFVLLAHEMGHAVRVRGGGYAADEQFDWFGESKPTWQRRAEEMSNVIGIENPIREESGITTRSTYKTWKVVHGTPALDQIMLAFIPVMRSVQDAGFTEAEAWAWAKTQPAAKKLFLYGSMTTDPFSDAELLERKDLKDRVSTPLIAEAQGALPTFFSDFVASKVPTLLRPYLDQISGDAVKGGALMNGLTAGERSQALVYLHSQQTPVAQIQTLLHFGKSDLFGTTESKRAAARLAAVRELIKPGGTVATATTERKTTSSIWPWA